MAHCTHSTRPLAWAPRARGAAAAVLVQRCAAATVKRSNLRLKVEGAGKFHLRAHMYMCTLIETLVHVPTIDPDINSLSQTGNWVQACFHMYYGGAQPTTTRMYLRHYLRPSPTTK